MNTPKLARDSSQKHFRNPPAIAGLIAAGVVAFLMCGRPQSRFLSLGELIHTAIERVLIILSASAISIWGFGPIHPARRPVREQRLMLRITFDAVWFAPLALFVCQHSAWAAAMTAVLVVSMVRSFRCLGERLWQIEDTFTPARGLADPTIELSEAESLFFPRWSAICAALCAQSGTLATLVGHPFAGSMLVGIASATWTWSLPAEARTSQGESADSWRRALIVVLAILFTAAALSRYLIPGYRMHAFGTSSQHHLQHGFSQNRETGRELPSGVRKAYTGVVLWPEEHAPTKLIAPVLTNDASSTRSADRWIIPFDGVYWFFRAPDLRPPADSREAHGSPEQFDIRSTDGHYLAMEAHQNLGREIDLTCCSRIEVAIRNRDRYPQTVAIELRLINTALARKPSQSLGTLAVNSTPPWKFDDDRSAAIETLDFAIPANPLIRRFDEVMVIFQLNRRRADAAAKIAIDWFVLIPRGL